jgi:hypothetical protein
MASRRLASVTAALAAGALAMPSAALASHGGGGGGGGGGGTPPVPTQPAPDAVQCDFGLDGFLPDGGLVFSNQIGDAGCLRVVDRGGDLSIYDLQVSPGWTAEADSNGGSGGVRVTFTQTATGHVSTARIERGKTDIRL